MNNSAQRTSQSVKRLASVETELLWLESAFQAADFHKNRLVEESIKQASEEFQDAVNELTAGNIQAALELADVVWLRVVYARKLLEGDVSEHLLGEDDYLNLERSSTPTDGLMGQYFSELCALIEKLRERLSAKT